MEELLFYAPVLLILLSAVVTDGADDYAEIRWRMVEDQIIARGIRDSAVINAMLRIPRHEFVPPESRESAYGDSPVPIGRGQTISQPYIVALMSEVLRPAPGRKVLEVGTGSGYQTAILAETGAEVYTIEIIPELAERTRRLLEKLGYTDIHFRVGDGYAGWEENAPYDGIIVTAAPGDVPEALVSQLKEGGRMVIPVGGENQELLLIEKSEKGVSYRKVTSVRFVPMTGEPGPERV
ncbi:MAG: protein-L-isoaspartate(D-aspartate) O-methyltransferase [Candidatus Dadabacteria bacterium]|nr:protein-L-isoaspartate(D-aspartate) O-methyltransferase [Candidatus Dadabacteria bacterium]